MSFMIMCFSTAVELDQAVKSALKRKSYTYKYSYTALWWSDISYEQIRLKRSIHVYYPMLLAFHSNFAEKIVNP